MSAAQPSRQHDRSRVVAFDPIATTTGARPEGPSVSASVKERPIVMSGPIVVATIEGRKTQTRRLVRALPNGLAPQCYVGRNGERWTFTGGDRAGDAHGLRCPYGASEDRLWVKEAWGVGTRPHPAHGWIDGLEYKADALAGDDALPLREVAPPEGVSLSDFEGKGWRSPRFMPRWASRLTLEITEIRVQRLQDISEEDARGEGVELPCVVDADCPPGKGRPLIRLTGPCPPIRYLADPRAASIADMRRAEFASLWDSINGKRLVGGQPATWKANPWVWAISYRVVNP